MQIVFTEREYNQVIDMAKADGANSVKDLQMWLEEHINELPIMFKHYFTVNYGEDAE